MARKSRLETAQKILHALEKLLLEQGFAAAGINAIARQAGCDKVLIYRYFGGYDGLLQAFADSRQLWWEVDGMITESAADIAHLPLHEYLRILLKRHADELQLRPLTLEVMAWEMSAQNNLTISLAKKRAEQGMLLVKKIRAYYQQPNIDIGGILGVFGAAINYLVIRTRHASKQYQTEEWWRLQQTIDQLLGSDAA